MIQQDKTKLPKQKVWIKATINRGHTLGPDLKQNWLNSVNTPQPCEHPKQAQPCELLYKLTYNTTMTTKTLRTSNDIAEQLRRGQTNEKIQITKNN